MKRKKCPSVSIAITKENGGEKMEMKEDFKKIPKGNWKRFYSPKSYKLMSRTRIVLLVLTAPIWFPLYLLLRVMIVATDLLENLLDLADDLLQKFLDKVIPQRW